MSLPTTSVRSATRPSQLRSRLRAGFIFGAAAVACVAVAATCARVAMARAAAGLQFELVDRVPQRPVAIVFGAGLTPDGYPSPMLADRVDAGIALYRAGRVGHLLFTGDNSRPDYNEVGAMLSYAVNRGLPVSEVTLDYAGFDTYDSCYRAKAIFGIRSAVLVTQAYHLPRALYDCTHLGIEAVGLATPDWGAYDARTMLAYETRETLADIKAFWDINVTRRPPALLGHYLGLR